MRLQQFLELHIEQMKVCFNITNFDIGIQRGETSNQMEISVDYEYLDAGIVYDKKIIRSWKDKDTVRILKCLAHELTHILTGELKTNHKKTECTFYDERATEHISRLLYRLYTKEMNEIKTRST